MSIYNLLHALAEVKVPSQLLSQALLQEIEVVFSSKLEAKAVVEQLLAFYCSVDQTALVLNQILSLSASLQKRIREGLVRLKNHEPLQYVIGESYFAGNFFKVTPAVLIPRPETEEWLLLLLSKHVTSPTSILDIGTGSGCLAITLKQHFPETKVDAIDISEAALKIAIYNMHKIGVEVNFIKSDILKAPLPASKWSLIVSNPPYVRLSEKEFMAKNVLNYEPHVALFVEERDPLLFYRRIASLAICHLCRPGMLCLEINEAFGGEVVDLLYGVGFRGVSLHKDFFGKDRFVIAVL